MVCVPDSILQRDCHTDVYSIGMLILQLMLGIDLFHASIGELQQVETHQRDLSPNLIAFLQLIFSGNCTIEDIFEHEYFRNIPDNEFAISTPVCIHFTDTSAEPLIGENSINLACFEQDARKPYFAHVSKLLEKNEQGKSGIRLLEEQLVNYIDQGQSSFKNISLPRPDQIILNGGAQQHQNRDSKYNTNNYHRFDSAGDVLINSEQTVINSSGALLDTDQ